MSLGYVFIITILSLLFLLSHSFKDREEIVCLETECDSIIHVPPIFHVYYLWSGVSL